MMLILEVFTNVSASVLRAFKDNQCLHCWQWKNVPREMFKYTVTGKTFKCFAGLSVKCSIKCQTKFEGLCRT